MVNLGFTDDDQIWEKYDDDLTTDAAKIQQELTSDEYYMKYVPKTEGTLQQVQKYMVLILLFQAKKINQSHTRTILITRSWPSMNG